MIELKPCPFCGRIPIVDDCGDNSFFVRCKCGIAQDKLYGQRCDAVRRWNTRRKQPERKKGKWLEIAGDLQCSECGATYHDLYPDYSDTKFCPNCGSYNGGENDQSK